MQSLGYNVTAHRVGAYAVAGLLAAVGGVLMVCKRPHLARHHRHRRDDQHPDHRGARRHEASIGAFVGAIAFVLLQNFAIDLVDANASTW